MTNTNRQRASRIIDFPSSAEERKRWLSTRTERLPAALKYDANSRVFDLAQLCIRHSLLLCSIHEITESIIKIKMDLDNRGIDFEADLT